MDVVEIPKIKILVKKDKLVIFLLHIFLFIALDFSYVKYVVAEHLHMGFTCSFSSFSLIVGIIVFLIPLIILLITKIDDFTYGVLNLIFLFSVIPSIITYKYQLIEFKIMFAHLFFFLSVFLWCRYAFLNIKVKMFEERKSYYLLFAIAILSIVPFVIIFTPHINLSNLVLNNIYETRAIQKEISGLYTSYMYSWLSKVLIPILLVLALIFKKKLEIGILFSMLIFLFLCGAHKSVLIGTLLVFFFYKGSYTHKIKYFLYALNFVVFFGVLLYLLNDHKFINSLITRRIFFLPSLLDSYYFSFFHDNYLYWSGSFMKYLIEYPYNFDPPQLIGEVFFDSSDVSANNGIISDGYANLGMLGIFINVTFVSFYLMIIKSLKISNKFFGVIFLFVFTLISSSLTTILLTHGGLLFILISSKFLKNTYKYD